MNEYNFNVNFETGKIKTSLKKLVQNDYNSTKLNFTFDKEGRVVFKMLYPDGGTTYIADVENNELILEPGVLSHEGDYEVEISLYTEDSKLTAYATKSFYVRNQLINTDNVISGDDRVPVLDTLINEVEVDKAYIEGLKEAVERGDFNGQDGAEGPQGPQGVPGEDGTDATINGVSTINIVAGDNVTIEQEDGTLTINSTGGGTTDYTNLNNKPSINNILLSGNKTSSDLGLQPAGNYLTSETDPVFSASASAEITNSDISNWNAKYDKPATGIPKTDLSSDVQTSLGKADTALQSYTEQYTGTITGITMNGASKGTSGVVDLGTVITQHQDISGKQDTMQFSTMPTPSAETVGKIVQYIGTTNANYTNGYFYIGTTDGEAIPTYSWSNVEVQNMPDLSEYLNNSEVIAYKSSAINLTLNTNGTISLTNVAAKNAVVSAINKHIDKEPFMVCFIDSNKNMAIMFIQRIEKQYGSNVNFNPTFLYLGANGGAIWFGTNRLVVTFNATTGLVNNINYILDSTYGTKEIIKADRVLTKTNTDTYTPTADYHPATKKYVDDAVSTSSTPEIDFAEVDPVITLLNEMETDGISTKLIKAVNFGENQLYQGDLIIENMHASEFKGYYGNYVVSGIVDTDPETGDTIVSYDEPEEITTKEYVDDSIAAAITTTLGGSY